jgi:hypothetical protein
MIPSQRTCFPAVLSPVLPGRLPDRSSPPRAGFSPSFPREQQYLTENIESAFTLVQARLGYTLYPDIPQARQPGLRYIPVTDLETLPFGIFYRYDNDHPVMKQFPESFVFCPKNF